MATVLTAWTRLIVDYAARQGLTEAEVLAATGLPTEALTAPRIAAEHNQDIWTHAALALGQPDLGVHLSEHTITWRALGVVGMLARTAPTVEHALAVGARYHRLIKESGEVALQRRGELLVVHDWPAQDGAALAPARRRWPRAMAEAIIANYVTLARQWTGVELTPREVSFQHDPPERAHQLERFFGCPVRFAAPTNSVTFHRDVALLPLATWDQDVQAQLEDSARRELAALGGDDLADVVAAISALLERGDLDVTRVARHLATSPRSLQRRLTERKASFRALVDSARCRRAVTLLQAGHSLEQIAERIGFSDERALRRALRRWTGRTARQVSRPMSPMTSGSPLAA